MRFRALTNDVFPNDGRHYVTIWMEGRDASGDTRLVASDEVDEIVWSATESFPKPLFPPLERLVLGECLPPEGRLGV